MMRSRRKINMGPHIQCFATVTDGKRRAKLCDVPGKETRIIDGMPLTFCYRHADEIDAKQAAEAAKKGGAA